MPFLRALEVVYDDALYKLTFALHTLLHLPFDSVVILKHGLSLMLCKVKLSIWIACFT